VNQEFNTNHEDFMLLQDNEFFRNFDIVGKEQDAPFTREVDIFRSNFNTTPIAETSEDATSTWNGCYSVMLHNVPWFLFQRLLKKTGWSIP
jgi:hypothetical protein